jgi:FKBP-type peptidyl-prolyl cis-trans isomerase
MILGIGALIGVVVVMLLGILMLPKLLGSDDTIIQGTAVLPTEVPYDTTGYTTTDSGLKYLILDEGDGPRPQTGDRVTVAYRGTLTDGTEFDSGTYPFVLGTGAVIEGWDEGIALLNQGSKAILVIPSDLGYGPFGSGPIPPNATLIFEVELLEVEQQ